MQAHEIAISLTLRVSRHDWDISAEVDFLHIAGLTGSGEQRRRQGQLPQIDGPLLP